MTRLRYLTTATVVTLCWRMARESTGTAAVHNAVAVRPLRRRPRRFSAGRPDSSISSMIVRPVRSGAVADHAPVFDYAQCRANRTAGSFQFSATFDRQPWRSYEIATSGFGNSATLET